MDKKVTKVNFTLLNITTEQFAIIEEAYNEKGKIRIATNLRFGSDNNKKTIAVFSSFVFESDEKPFLIIEAGCHFKILDESWNEMHNTVSNILTVPKGFISHMSVITIGTARGVLHAKTEKTPFNKFVLPTINVTELVKEDIIFRFNKDEEKH